MNKTLTFFLCVCVFAGASIFSGCSTSDSMMSKAATYMGETQAFGSDSIRSWVKTDENGNPSSVGVTFKESSFASLSSTEESMTMIMLPSMSTGGMMKMMASPFDHVEVDWVPQGDPAPSVYNKAHLDCHFFMMSEMNQMGIMGGRDTSMMDMKYMPHGYMMDSVSEEGMGVHCMDTMSKEFHGQPFDHTFVFGSYHGSMVFMEAMCAKSFLDLKTTTTTDIRQPQAYMMMGYYPMKYTVRYDAAAKEYSISLDGLTSH
ncbi:MAG: hypothetical protein Q8916_13375 [Bacteroidota bacterium]|nr:hypothetical protein [Bacteroidota bacterium]MDP4231384.1 hypothetical protein [Bacteroidota bacterium]MDP4237450.1 hypothetical protein [Bacteroidota bacterium]